MMTEATEGMIQGETTIATTQGIELDDVKTLPIHSNHDQAEKRMTRKTTCLVQVYYAEMLSGLLTHVVTSATVASASTSHSRPNLDPDAPDDQGEEEMDAGNDDDAAMMAMMGMTGFGSTKAYISYILIAVVTLTFSLRTNTSKVTKRVQLMSRK